MFSSSNPNTTRCVFQQIQEPNLQPPPSEPFAPVRSKVLTNLLGFPHCSSPELLPGCRQKPGADDEKWRFFGDPFSRETCNHPINAHSPRSYFLDISLSSNFSIPPFGLKWGCIRKTKHHPFSFNLDACELLFYPLICWSKWNWCSFSFRLQPLPPSSKTHKKMLASWESPGLNHKMGDSLGTKRPRPGAEPKLLGTKCLTPTLGWMLPRFLDKSWDKYPTYKNSTSIETPVSCFFLFLFGVIPINWFSQIFFHLCCNSTKGNKSARETWLPSTHPWWWTTVIYQGGIRKKSQKKQIKGLFQ